MVYGIYCGFIIIHLHQIDIPKLDYKRIIFFYCFLLCWTFIFMPHLSNLCLTNTEMPVLYVLLIKYDCIEIYRHSALSESSLSWALSSRYYLYSGEFSCSVYIPLVQSSLFPNQSAFLSQMEQAHGCCQATVWPSTLQGSHGNHPLCQFIQWL